MTKYVLNSGGLRKNPEKAKKFFEEVLSGLGESPKLLICNFALTREDWEAKFSEDVEYFKDMFGDKIVLSLAFPNTFEEQMKEVDAVYIHGGDDRLAQYWLKKFDLPRIWDGKVVATNSASSHALATYFWTCDWRECMEGLGILPIKFLAHFKSSYGNDDPRGSIDWENAYAELEKYKDTSLPIYALEEGDYNVFEA